MLPIPSALLRTEINDDYPDTLSTSLAQGQFKDTMGSAPVSDTGLYTVPPPKKAESALVTEHAMIICFDIINDIENAKTPKTRKAVLAEFCKEFFRRGFVGILAPELHAMLPKVNEEIKKYFARTNKEEDIHNNSGQTGYVQRGVEKAAGADVGDDKEYYMVPPNFTKWPTNCGEFPEVIGKFHQMLTFYASKCLGYICEYVGIEVEDSFKSMMDALNLTRLLHYFPKDPNKPSKAEWSAMHEDLNAITLIPKPKVPGLYLVEDVYENNGVKEVRKWVTAPDGCFLLNAGKQMENKFAGLVKAVKHGVINPGGEYEYAERFVAVFFASFSKFFDISPHKKCIEMMTQGKTKEEIAAYVKKYPSCNAQDFLHSRLYEMGYFEFPKEGVVANEEGLTFNCEKQYIAYLRKKGLIMQPPKELIKKYPELFVESKNP